MDSSDTAQRLVDVGLSGEQLEVKFFGLNKALKRFVTWGTVPALEYVLDWINGILGSLSQVLPGIEALKEFKETVEKLIKRPH